MPTFSHTCKRDDQITMSFPPAGPTTIRVDLAGLADLQRQLQTAQDTLAASQAENTRLVEENRRLKAGAEAGRRAEKGPVAIGGIRYATACSCLTYPSDNVPYPPFCTRCGTPWRSLGPATRREAANPVPQPCPGD